MIFLCLVICIAIISMNTRNRIIKHEARSYQSSIYEADFFAENLCVTNEEVEFDAFHTNDEFKGALLFDIENKKTLFSENANNKLYPASTTKILTAYVALKHGNLEDYVTISETAVDVPSDSSTAHLQVGDVLSLKDLLYALMLPSGNDSAVAIAEHISGDVATFVELMNEEAKQLGASNTHFVNPHGLHNKEHYTTAYDIYLILNELVHYNSFLSIIAMPSCDVNYVDAQGNAKTKTFNSTNLYFGGRFKVPDGIEIIGGKTGTTNAAGCCLTLYFKSEDGTSYIAEVFHAPSYEVLYGKMTELMRIAASE
mgnify:CR=1 FL=1